MSSCVLSMNKISQNVLTNVVFYRRVPLNRLLLETDAPYFLHPNVPKRVQYAHPSMAIYVAEKVASLKGIHISEVLRHARHNTHTVYNL